MEMVILSLYCAVGVLKSGETFVFVKMHWRHFQCSFFLSSKSSSRRLQGIVARRFLFVCKMSWRRLEEDNMPVRLEDVCKTSCEEVLKMSWRLLKNVFGRCLANWSWRCRGRWKSITLKTSSRNHQDVLENKKCLLGLNRCWPNF